MVVWLLGRTQGNAPTGLARGMPSLLRIPIRVATLARPFVLRTFPPLTREPRPLSLRMPTFADITEVASAGVTKDGRLEDLDRVHCHRAGSGRFIRPKPRYPYQMTSST